MRLGVSLRTRLTLWYGALLALALLAFSTFLFFTLQQSLASSMDTRLGVRAEVLHSVACHHDVRGARTAEAAVLYHANQLDAVAATRPVSD